MPQKTATFFSCEKDEACDELRKYIEDAGIRLIVRDLEKSPMSVRELDQLFGHNPLTYFINPAAEEYARLGLDNELPERGELLQLMADNPGLLRRPIIKTVRLLTVGWNKEKIAEMLQINRNGDGQDEVPDGNRGGKITRRSLPARK